MIEIKKPARKKWFIINCENPITGFVETNQVFTSGNGTLEELEIFITKKAWIARKSELGIEPENIIIK